MQTLFMQLAGPLANMGSFFRQMDETAVDVEELYNMMQKQPLVREKSDAKEFEYKGGNIKIENLSFKHYFVDSALSEEGKDSKLVFQER